MSKQDSRDNVQARFECTATDLHINSAPTSFPHLTLPPHSLLAPSSLLSRLLRHACPRLPGSRLFAPSEAKRRALSLRLFSRHTVAFSPLPSQPVSAPSSAALAPTGDQHPFVISTWQPVVISTPPPALAHPPWVPATKTEGNGGLKGPWMRTSDTQWAPHRNCLSEWCEFGTSAPLRYIARQRLDVRAEAILRHPQASCKRFVGTLLPFNPPSIR